MAFFNLTHVGRQNVFAELKITKDSSIEKEKAEVKPAPDRSLVYKTPMISHVKYQELKTKHVRRPDEPHELYQKPLTCSQEIGWWQKDEPIDRNLPWTYVKKHVYAKSEMTAFSDKMSLTDKSFKMY